MNALVPPLIAFAIGAVFTWLEFLTSKYPNTCFLIYRSRPLVIYCIIYGLIAVAGFYLSGTVLPNATLDVKGPGVNSLYVRAIVMGLSSKAIMQLNIFTVTAGTTSFPIGLQTVVQLFSPYLVRLIDLEEFNDVRKFVQAFAAKFADLNAVSTIIEQNIPPSISQQDRAAFMNDIGKDHNPQAAMERYLRFLGRKTFLTAFVNPQGPLSLATGRSVAEVTS